MKKGRPYFYIREIKRVGGKPKVISQVYLGSVENIRDAFVGKVAALAPRKIKVEEWGSLFLAYEIEKELGLIGIIDSIVPRAPREKGPSIGEYFFYAWANRLIDPRSKNAYEDWFQQTAIQDIRPVDPQDLSSKKYWAKWDRVEEADIRKMASALFAAVWRDQERSPECVLFDTTNYYTFMASETDSELCQRGHNKEGRHHLRQVGLGLVVDHESRLPLYYKEYAGNIHDSKQFQAMMDEIFGALCQFNTTKQLLTVVFDKGMNSEDNIQVIDGHPRVHFITTYSPYFVEDLAGADIKQFSPISTRAFLRRNERDREDKDRPLAYRTRLELWGKERTIVITHNPATVRKKTYTLERKLESVREALLEYRKAYREERPHWRDPEAIRSRYDRLCEDLHLGSQYYRLEFTQAEGKPDLSFRKDIYQVRKAEELFGRNVIVTDHHDWTTEEIVQNSLDRSIVEDAFRASKDDHHICVHPIYHWTDSKIRCHLLTCVIALTVERLIEMKLERAGTTEEFRHLTGRTIVDAMRSLHSVLMYYPDKVSARRLYEDPTPLQSEVLKAFGWEVTQGGVLHSLKNEKAAAQ